MIQKARERLEERSFGGHLLERTKSGSNLAF
jgi:hypothetical protein